MRKGRRGQFELLALLVEVGILIIGLVLIVGFVRDFWRPHEQIATANVAALTFAIEQVCQSGQTKAINFEMPQPVAFYSDTVGAVATGVSRNSLPRFQIRSQGGPQFVLYWQSVSPVYGLRGWDYYFDLPKRAFAYIPDDAAIDDVEDIKNFITAAKGRTDVDTVLVPNLRIGTDQFLGSTGTWEENFYKFNKTFTTDLDKTSIKYRPCGDGICFKTRRGIRKVPFSCDLPIMVRGIETARLFFPPFETYGTEDIDFNLASPCKADIKIERTTCECRFHEYSLWEIDDQDKVSKKGSTKTHCLGEDFSSDVLDPDLPEKEFSCIRVTLSDREGYCRVSTAHDFFEKTPDNSIVITRDTKELRTSFGKEICSWPAASCGPDR